MPKTQPAATTSTSSRIPAAFATALALVSVFASQLACSETTGAAAALAAVPIAAHAYGGVGPDFPFNIVPADVMARMAGAAATSSPRLILPDDRMLGALPVERMTSSVATLADAIHPHFLITAEGVSISAALRLNAALQLPQGGRILIDIAQRVQQ